MEPTFVDQLAQSRYGPMVRCGVHDKSLQAKRMSIADAERFVEQVDRDINSQSGKLDAANVAGIVSWSADARASLDQSIRTSRANVRKMRELLKKIDAKIADDARSDDGGPAPVRSEALPPQGAVSLPGLR